MFGIGDGENNNSCKRKKNAPAAPGNAARHILQFNNPLSALFCPAPAIQIPRMGSNHYLCEPVNLAINYP